MVGVVRGRALLLSRGGLRGRDGEGMLEWVGTGRCEGSTMPVESLREH